MEKFSNPNLKENDMEVDKETIVEVVSLDEPSLPYDYVLWCQEMSKFLEELAKEYADNASAEIIRIHQDGVEDDRYEVVDDVEVKNAVDLDKLKAEQPEIYAKISKISNSDVVRLITPETSYELARISPNFSSSMESVTLGDLKKALGKGDASYIKKVFKVKDKIIVPAGTWEDPRFERTQPDSHDDQLDSLAGMAARLSKRSRAKLPPNTRRR